MLAIFYGLFVGLCLGFTGGGGGLLAVPLLIYGCQVAPPQAISISLIVVGISAFFGVLGSCRQHTISYKIGSIIAIASITTAPLGTRISLLLPHRELMLAFAVIMLIVAAVIWSRTMNSGKLPTKTPPAFKIHYILLIVTGLVVGLLAGLFGIGGGFVVVPALILFADFKIHQAISTSLFAVTITSCFAFLSHFLQGHMPQIHLTLMFTVGGIVGTLLGIALTPFISSKYLQRGFSSAITTLACFVVIRQFI